MNLHWIDWSIIIGVFAIIFAVATYTKRYVHGVSDFLSANRCAGRYLLTVSESIASLGAISLVAWYESGLQSGFTAIWWSMMQSPVGILIAVSGWIIYRFRQTRCLTLAEFLERRYSRKFRTFCGFIIFFSGILNFGIFFETTFFNETTGPVILHNDERRFSSQLEGYILHTIHFRGILFFSTKVNTWRKNTIFCQNHVLSYRLHFVYRLHFADRGK